MAPISRKAVGAREPFPGNINVTPLPHEPPIRSRPILQSHPAMPAVVVNAKLPYTSTSHYEGDSFNWPIFVLFLFLSVSLGVILSKWGWDKITGKLWKWSAGWDSPLVDEDEEQLLEGTSEVETDPKYANHTVDINEIQHTSPSNIEQTQEDDWIANHTRGI
jgi:hypothetical protein